MFFEYHAQNLNTPQNNSASWDLQMGFNWAFKGLITQLIAQNNSPSWNANRFSANQ
jgi:hypothetical protein